MVAKNAMYSRVDAAITREAPARRISAAVGSAAMAITANRAM